MREGLSQSEVYGGSKGQRANDSRRLAMGQKRSCDHTMLLTLPDTLSTMAGPGQRGIASKLLQKDQRPATPPHEDDKAQQIHGGWMKDVPLYQE
jgi:hypothetical protein